MELSFKNPGAVPSKPDYRSAIIASAVAEQSATPTPTLPEAYTTDFQKLGGALNQSQTPSCVSHAMGQLMKLWWYAKTGEVVSFSPRFLHILSGNPAYNGGAQYGPDDGRDPVTVAKIAMKYGCATVAACPNDTALPNAQYSDVNFTTPAMLAEAVHYVIPGYVMVTVNQLAIRQTVQKYGAVSLLMRIGAEWWTAPNGTPSQAEADIDPVRPPKTIIGGHELVGSGWNASLDHLMNHWSAAWAQNGESDYLWNEWQNFIVEALAIADVPGPALSLVKGLPAPDEFLHTFSTSIVYGQTGQEVRALQIALAIDGENPYPEITGNYLTNTAAAVTAFQKKYAVADPVTIAAIEGKNVGPLTRAKLNQLFSPKVAPPQ